MVCYDHYYCPAAKTCSIVAKRTIFCYWRVLPKRAGLQATETYARHKIKTRWCHMKNTTFVAAIHFFCWSLTMWLIIMMCVAVNESLQMTCYNKLAPTRNVFRLQMKVLDCLAVIRQAPPREVRRPPRRIIHVDNLKVLLRAKALGHSYIEWRAQQLLSRIKIWYVLDYFYVFINHSCSPLNVRWWSWTYCIHK